MRSTTPSLRNISRYAVSPRGSYAKSRVIGAGGAVSILVAATALVECHRQSMKEKQNESSSCNREQLPLIIDTPNNLHNVPFRFPITASYSYCEPSQKPPSWFSGWIFNERKKESAPMDNDNRSLKHVYDVNWNAPLGEGGFGAVFAATNKSTHEQVAMKKISKKFTTSAQFQREMWALLHIRKAGGHPNICGLREKFDEGKHYYLALDLVSGGEMFDHLINSGPYSEADAARLVREVASALAFLHGIGIVHGDLKPENVMLSTSKASDAVVKLIDFGTAQVLDDDGNVAVPAPVGITPAYSPPEALMEKKSASNMTTKPSLDMWSLGVILYIMLMGCHPFDLSGDTPDELIRLKILQHRAPPLKGSLITRHLSDSSMDLIEKLLTWDESKRITAHEMLEHPWVRCITAKTNKIEDSDTKLSKFRPFKSRLEAKVFADILSWSGEIESESQGNNNMSLIERSFRKLDSGAKGYITTSDVGKGVMVAVKDTDNEESLSLSAFSNLLAENMQNFFFKKGDIVYSEGDKGCDMFFINSGVVEVNTEDGFRTTLKQGDFVGEGALLSNKPRSGTVTCITPVHAIKITKDYFEKYLKSSDSGLSLKMLEKCKDRATSRTMFSGFSDLLSENMKNESFDKGAVVFQEGEEGNDMFFINEGVVEVTNKDGFRATLTQGDFVGEGALLSKKRRSATVTCLSPVKGMKITKDYFDKYMAMSDSDLTSKMHEKNKERELSRTKIILRKQKNLRPREVSEGQVLYKEGDRMENLLILLDGAVDVDIDHRRAYRIKPGDIIGGYSLFFERPFNAAAHCISKSCNIVELEPRSFHNLLDSSPALKRSIREICLKREFQKAVVLETKREFPTDVHQLRKTFTEIDKNNNGAISLADVARLMRNMNLNITDEEIREIFQSIDLGNRGSINFETFCRQ